ncbi:hypothetical protein PJW08_09265 [Tenacibaculum finnmarkense]|nr:hypothetical protein PJW08_09265 [Tenacibaculum finnmarkense]
MKIQDPFSDIETILWERKPQELLNEKWLGNRIIIHGHTPQKKTAIIRQLNEKIIGIDNGNYLNTENDYGSLTILELGLMKIKFINED